LVIILLLATASLQGLPFEGAGDTVDLHFHFQDVESEEEDPGLKFVPPTTNRRPRVEVVGNRALPYQDPNAYDYEGQVRQTRVLSRPKSPRKTLQEPLQHPRDHDYETQKSKNRVLPSRDARDPNDSQTQVPEVITQNIFLEHLNSEEEETATRQIFVNLQGRNLGSEREEVGSNSGSSSSSNSGSSSSSNSGSSSSSKSSRKSSSSSNRSIGGAIKGGSNEEINGEKVDNSNISITIEYVNATQDSAQTSQTKVDNSNSREEITREEDDTSNGSITRIDYDDKSQENRMLPEDDSEAVEEETEDKPTDPSSRKITGGLRISKKKSASVMETVGDDEIEQDILDRASKLKLILKKLQQLN